MTDLLPAVLHLTDAQSFPVELAVGESSVILLTSPFHPY